MARIISVMNQKGGTAKTTSVVNIAARLAYKGYKTLIVDMEPQANATLYLGIDPLSLEASMYEVLLREMVSIKDVIMTTHLKNLHLAPAQVALAKADINLSDKPYKQRRLKEKLEYIRESYDYIIIDCPPSLSLLPINALTASSDVLIPLQANYLSLEGLKQVKNSIDKVKDELNPSLNILGILFAIVDMRNEMANRCMNLARGHFGDKIFDTVIRFCPKFDEAPIAGRSIFEYDPGSEGAADYKRLTEEILQRTRAPVKNRLQSFFGRF